MNEQCVTPYYNKHLSDPPDEQVVLATKLLVSESQQFKHYIQHYFLKFITPNVIIDHDEYRQN
jgi:hypothetical protein